MRFEDKQLKAQRRRASWLVGLICGPVFAIVFCMAWFIPPLLADYHLGLWLPLIGSIAVAAPLGDRIGKKYRITAEQFAGPMALCSMLFCGALIFLVYSFLN